MALPRRPPRWVRLRRSCLGRRRRRRRRRRRAPSLARCARRTSAPDSTAARPRLAPSGSASPSRSKVCERTIRTCADCTSNGASDLAVCSVSKSLIAKGGPRYGYADPADHTPCPAVRKLIVSVPVPRLCANVLPTPRTLRFVADTSARFSRHWCSPATDVCAPVSMRRLRGRPVGVGGPQVPPRPPPRRRGRAPAPRRAAGETQSRDA